MEVMEEMEAWEGTKSLLLDIFVRRIATAMECHDTRQQNVALSKQMILLLGEGALFPLIIALVIMLRCEQ